VKLAVCRLFGAYTRFILNPHKPEVGSSSLPFDTIDVLLIDTLTALFALFLSLKFPKSMVQFFKFLQNAFDKFTLLPIVKFSILKGWIANILKIYYKVFFFTLSKILTHSSSRLTFTGFSPPAKAVSTTLLR